MSAFKIVPFLCFCFSILVTSTTLHASEPEDSEYLDGGNSKIALILCHGRGKHPTWKVVEPLRIGVNDQLGYHTLSLQMPNEKKSFRKYAEDFDQAYDTIQSAIEFLKKEKGVTRIYLMGHSMGSRMASSFVAEKPTQAINGLILAGCRNSGGPPLDCEENVTDIKIPILDIWGGDNEKDSDAATDREALVSDIYQQVSISDGNHKFDGVEDEFVSAVVKWLKSQQVH
jgi:dienelactone hydrolase